MNPERARRPRPPAPPFALGATYWSRRSGLALWTAFDEGEIREDFARLAGLGLDTVRLLLRWDLFQPEPEAPDETMLARFERVLELAADTRLQVLASVLCGHVFDVTYVPAWAIAAGAPTGGYRVFTGDRPSRGGAGDLYRGPLLEAQIRFAEGIARRCGAHPALGGWEIANAFDRVREPSHRHLATGGHSSEPADERAIAEWARRIRAALREHSRAPVSAGADVLMVKEDREVRFDTLHAALDRATIAGDAVAAPFARGRLDVEAVPFLAMLTANLSQHDVLVTGFGAGACPPGTFSAFERFAERHEPPLWTVPPGDPTFAPFPCATEDEAAAYAGAVLERLHVDGRLGALWTAWTDVTPEQRERPPFDRRPDVAASGLVRADGTERPVARAFAAFARTEPRVRRAEEMQALASAYYYRTLPTSMTTLYEAYHGFVAPRRSAPP